jgi:hypothetical protein
MYDPRSVLDCTSDCGDKQRDALTTSSQSDIVHCHYTDASTSTPSSSEAPAWALKLIDDMQKRMNGLENTIQRWLSNPTTRPTVLSDPSTSTLMSIACVFIRRKNGVQLKWYAPPAFQHCKCEKEAAKDAFAKSNTAASDTQCLPYIRQWDVPVM